MFLIVVRDTFCFQLHFYTFLQFCRKWDKSLKLEGNYLSIITVKKDNMQFIKVSPWEVRLVSKHSEKLICWTSFLWMLPGSENSWWSFMVRCFPLGLHLSGKQYCSMKNSVLLLSMKMSLGDILSFSLQIKNCCLICGVDTKQKLGDSGFWKVCHLSSCTEMLASSSLNHI